MNDYNNIPIELQRLNQWVNAYEGDKLPMKAWENSPASSSNPSTWSDFKTARESVEELHLYDYCGFVFNDNGYVGIDIDLGYNGDILSDLAFDIIQKCKSYTEKSKSGRGFHIILKGSLPFSGRNNLQGVEIYKKARYFIMTGDTCMYDTISSNQEAIDYVVGKYFTDVRENDCTAYSERIYSPIWENVYHNGKIALRPFYPTINKGGRNVSMLSLAGSLHQAGWSELSLIKELKYANDIACIPPLQERELLNIVKSVRRYKRWE